MLRETVEKLIADSPLSDNYKNLWLEALDFMDQGEMGVMKDVLEKLPYADIIEVSKVLESKVSQYRKQEEADWEKLLNSNKTN